MFPKSQHWAKDSGRRDDDSTHMAAFRRQVCYGYSLYTRKLSAGCSHLTLPMNNQRLGEGKGLAQNHTARK